MGVDRRQAESSGVETINWFTRSSKSVKKNPTGTMQPCPQISGATLVHAGGLAMQKRQVGGFR